MWPAVRPPVSPEERRELGRRTAGRSGPSRRRRDRSTGGEPLLQGWCGQPRDARQHGPAKGVAGFRLPAQVTRNGGWTAGRSPRFPQASRWTSLVNRQGRVRHPYPRAMECGGQPDHQRRDSLGWWRQPGAEQGRSHADVTAVSRKPDAARAPSGGTLARAIASNRHPRHRSDRHRRLLSGRFRWQGGDGFTGRRIARSGPVGGQLRSQPSGRCRKAPLLSEGDCRWRLDERPVSDGPEASGAVPEWRG